MWCPHLHPTLLSTCVAVFRLVAAWNLCHGFPLIYLSTCGSADLGYFSHVTRDHPFQDSGLFYRFTEDAKSGGVAADESGHKVRRFRQSGCLDVRGFRPHSLLREERKWVLAFAFCFFQGAQLYI